MGLLSEIHHQISELLFGIEYSEVAHLIALLIWMPILNVKLDDIDCRQWSTMGLMYVTYCMFAGTFVVIILPERNIRPLDISSMTVWLLFLAGLAAGKWWRAYLRQERREEEAQAAAEIEATKEQ